MHYIRFLSPPSITNGSKKRTQQPTLKLVCTLSTDLGDTFANPSKPIPLVLECYGEDGPRSLLQPPGARKSARVSLGSWKTGMRVCKQEIPLQPIVAQLSTTLLREIIVTTERPVDAVQTAFHLLEEDSGAVVPAHYEFPVNETAARDGEDQRPYPYDGHVSWRKFDMVSPSSAVLDPPLLALELGEEIRDTIARRVWDGGVATAAMISGILQPSTIEESVEADDSRSERLQLVQTLRKENPQIWSLLTSADTNNILELGCGIGTLGIALATLCTGQSFMSDQPSPTSQKRILLTDLPEAAGVVEMNIHRAIVRFQKLSSQIHPQQKQEEPSTQNVEEVEATKDADAASSNERKLPVDLGYEDLDWEDGEKGIFGPQFQSTGWDLTIISDCTYNTDGIPLLVATLNQLHQHNRRLSTPNTDASLQPETVTRVLLSTKPRHESERVFFDEMTRSQWTIAEKLSLPLPRIDYDEEHTEVYLFEKRA